MGLMTMQRRGFIGMAIGLLAVAGCGGGGSNITAQRVVPAFTRQGPFPKEPFTYYITDPLVEGVTLQIQGVGDSLRTTRIYAVNEADPTQIAEFDVFRYSVPEGKEYPAARGVFSPVTPGQWRLYATALVNGAQVLVTGDPDGDPVMMIVSLPISAR